MRVLLLGGTAEGRALAKALHPGVDIVSSLAGRVPTRAAGRPGTHRRLRWRRGPPALAARRTHRRRHRRDPPVRGDHDGTRRASVRRTAPPASGLARPAWEPGDATVVKSDHEAAETVAKEHFSRVFLTTGRSGTTAFADSDAWF